MKTHPQEIAELLVKVNFQTNEIQDLRERLNLAEANLTIEIHTAKNEGGKPLFSNDELRKAEFVKQCHGNLLIHKLEKELRQKESERVYSLARIERLRLEYKMFLLDREEEINAKK